MAHCTIRNDENESLPPTLNSLYTPFGFPVIGGHEPVWTFTAPMEEGEYSVTFKEKYSFSAQQRNGTIFGESATLSSKFRVRQ